MTPEEQRLALQRTLMILHRKGTVTEFRAPNMGRFQTVSGYFSEHDPLIEAALKWDGQGNLYLLLNPAKPALLARNANKATPYTKLTTADHDIAERRLILIDNDPVRPAGISSSDEEHDAAIKRAYQQREWLWNSYQIETILADSGNGAHNLIYAPMPADSDSRALVKRVLEVFALLWDDDAVKVDISNFNEARITKFYGTKAVKGDDTPDRPHRYSRLLEVPGKIRPTSLEVLQEIAALLPQEEKPRSHPFSKAEDPKAFDVPAFLLKYGIRVKRETPYDGGTRWLLNCCPFNSDHTDNSAVIIQRSNGAVGFVCKHDSCKGQRWADFRKLYDPDYLTAEEWEAKRASRNGHSQRTHATERPVADRSEGLPVIETNSRQLPDMTAEAIPAILAANDPKTLFVRGGRLSRVHVDEKGIPSVSLLGEDALRGHLARAAHWVSTSEKRGEVNVVPPPCVVRDILSLPELPGLPPLEGIVTAPVFSPTGVIETAPGYHTSSRLYYYACPPLDLSEIIVTPQAIAQARDLILLEWLCDFPFEDDSSRAHAFSLFLLPFLRPIIDGPTPLYLIEAPGPGTGKGLLTEVLVLPFSPTGALLMTEGKDEDEWRKRVTASLRDASTHICIDNVRYKLNSANLAAVLTTTAWSDRLLGVSETIHLPNRAVWIGTGNNVSMSDEMTRRTVPIRLDARSDKPWMRDDFKIENLRAWTKEHRRELVTAALTLGRAWVEAGMPLFQDRRMGSFEHWAQVMGGILSVAGVPGFLCNLIDFYSRLDPEREEWLEFLKHWYTTHKNKSIGVKELFEMVQKGELLSSVLTIDKTGDNHAARVKLGSLLQKRVDRVYGDYRLERDGIRQRAVQWKVLFVGKPESDCESSETDESFSIVGGRVSEDDPLRAHARTRKQGDADTNKESAESHSQDSTDSLAARETAGAGRFSEEGL